MNTLRAVMWATSRWLQTDTSHKKNEKTMYLTNTIQKMNPAVGIRLRPIPVGGLPTAAHAFQE
jgi:hypothetical protein